MSDGLAERELSPFKTQVDIDIKSAFLNGHEFAEEHELNGTENVTCILQDITVEQELSSGNSSADRYYEVYGHRLLVNVAVSDLPEVPSYGQTFTVDGKLYLVDSVDNDMGILSITLEANEL